jgi:PPOX class probable F420-dependent enzyme
MPNRRELIRMTPDEVDEFLHGRRTMNVATFNHDGSIHLVAMWYGFLDGAPAFETFTKSQKVLNVRRDPRVTCLLEDGDTYDELRGLELVGTAEVIDDREPLMEVARSVVGRYHGLSDPDQIAQAAEILAHKRSAVKINVERIVSWDHTKLGGTY